MRRRLSNFPNSGLGRNSFISSTYSAATFSSSAGRGGGDGARGGGGGGRGRGRGQDLSTFGFRPGENTAAGDSNDESEGSASGRGRGRPLPSSPILPSFSSFMSGGPAAGRGRGVSAPIGNNPPPLKQQHPQPRAPIFFRKEEGEDFNPADSTRKTSPFVAPDQIPRKPAEETVLDVPSGFGRGKPLEPTSTVSEKPKEENRHIRPRQPSLRDRTSPGAGDTGAPAATRLSREEAIKKAVGILSRGGGRGRSGRGQGREGRRESWRDKEEEEDDDSYSGLYLGDDADGERMAQKLGPEIMDELAEGFEEFSERVLPSPMDDAYLDALHTNLLIECEPEYLMEEFGTNPDIEEKPPIPLRDALEKMKPFLMAYEGFQNQEEWEEAVRETMENVPLLKEIVDYYSGPDRVTAKQQQEELERVAQTLPESAPASVKRFTERAVLSLQSNPGWGFDKKCQFMDKLVWEVSQQYK